MPTPTYDRWRCDVVLPTDMETVVWTHTAKKHKDIHDAWKAQHPKNPDFINMVKLNRAAAHKIPNSLIKVTRLGKLSNKATAQKYDSLTVADGSLLS